MVDIHENTGLTGMEILVKPRGSVYLHEDGTPVILSDNNCIWAGPRTIWFTEVGFERFTTHLEKDNLKGMA